MCFCINVLHLNTNLVTNLLHHFRKWMPIRYQKVLEPEIQNFLVGYNQKNISNWNSVFSQYLSYHLSLTRNDIFSYVFRMLSEKKLLTYIVIIFIHRFHYFRIRNNLESEKDFYRSGKCMEKTSIFPLFRILLHKLLKYHKNY